MQCSPLTAIIVDAYHGEGLVLCPGCAYLRPMSSRLRSRPLLLGYIEPCQPSSVPKPPSGPDWLHEIKYDGFRLMAWRDDDRVRLATPTAPRPASAIVVPGGQDTTARLSLN